MRTLILTILAMVAFAANSLLCRMALTEPLMDAASFTTLRLVSGAVTLWLIVRLLMGRSMRLQRRAGWAALMLFLYAIGFSFAYLELSVGTGALILFGAVQITMMATGLCRGERLSVVQWTSFAAAVSGLVVLVFPGLTAPSVVGFILMCAAGVAWGIYSLIGRGTSDPFRDTAMNFILAAPIAVIITLVRAGSWHVTMPGAVLAVTSGALASGCGYVIWYAALRGLTVTRASMVQLSVPVIAAAGGVLFLSESVAWRLVVSGGLILGGVTLAVARERK